MIYDFIRRQQKAYPLVFLCAVMEVSRSEYYQYLKTGQMMKIDKDFGLLSEVRQIHRETRGSYGSLRTAERLRMRGHHVGRYRAGSLMKKAGVFVRHRQKFRITTDSKHNLPVAPNLLDRNFNVERPDAVWRSDITYLWTIEGWLYLAVVIDLFSRKVVGWAMSHRMKASLVMETLSMAYWRRKPERGLIHSDRGSQYAGGDYQRLLATYGMTGSMSRKGDCWDNAVVESFFHSLKTEWTFGMLYRSRSDARSDVIHYIKMFYNSHRLHSYLEYKNPNAFENNFMLAKAA